ncbi:RHS repeat-associated core domain-containing protein [Streptomyces sp. NPDC002746]
MASVDETGTKANTYDYNPRGETRATTNETAPQPYRYAGAYQDPTQLYKMGARYYDTNLGRFTQPDPSGQETNPYLYAGGGDPVNHTDPSGLSFFDGVGKAFDLYDVGSIAKDLDEGNYKDALATGVRMAAGAAAETGCGAVAAAAAAPTAGVGGLAVGATCFGVGYAAGDAGEAAASSILN